MKNKLYVGFDRQQALDFIADNSRPAAELKVNSMSDLWIRKKHDGSLFMVLVYKNQAGELTGFDTFRPSATDGKISSDLAALSLTE